MIDSDEEREDRIHNEAIVDAYGSEEQAMGWYYYLQDRIAFPFRGRCISLRSISPLKIGEVVEVLNMADEADCEDEMRVIIRLAKRTFGVPLSQIEPIQKNEENEKMVEAILDWHYWVQRGYTF